LGGRKLHKEELYKLYSSPNRIRMKTSRMMRGAGHEACLREGEFIRDLGSKTKRKEISRKTKTGWRIVLNWIFEK
jgi:hypothetical protein